MRFERDRKKTKIRSSRKLSDIRYESVSKYIIKYLSCIFPYKVFHC